MDTDVDDFTLGLDLRRIATSTADGSWDAFCAVQEAELLLRLGPILSGGWELAAPLNFGHLFLVGKVGYKTHRWNLRARRRGAVVRSYMWIDIPLRRAVPATP